MHDDAERLERVFDCVRNRCRGRDGAAFAKPFHAERIACRKILDMVEHERRRLVGARHGVVHEAAAEHLTVRTVNHFLAKCTTAALHHAARDLRVREQRVDDAAAIVDDDELLDRDDAGVAIHVDDELVLNPMLMTEDRLASLVWDYDLVTSRGALVHTAPLFAMDMDLETACRRHPRGFLFLVGSMHEYLLFDSLKMAASPTTHLGRLGRRGLETMLYLVDGVSEGIIARKGNYPPGLRFDYSGYLGPEETRPPEMSLVFVGYELGSGRRGFTEEALSAMRGLFEAQQFLNLLR